jgi:uncharacterized protein YutE (UPF0331/DUF86 family)
MRSEIETQESEVLQKLQKQYEAQGYKFVAQPGSADVPTFLEGYIPDAIAISEDEKVIIEVKSTERKAQQNSTVRFLASEVPKHEGWRFDLVIAEKLLSNTDASAEPGRHELVHEIEKVRKLSESGDYKSALVVGWAVLEALARKLVLNSKAGESRRYLPRSVVEALVSGGYADDKTGDRLSEISKIRNRLVHGFTKLEVRRADSEFIISFVESLVKEVD